MKRFYMIVLILVLLRSDFVKTFNSTDKPFDGRIQCNSTSLMIAVYVMAAIIVLLCFMVIGLLFFVYKLKKKTICDEEDKTEITKTDPASKYTRQLSSETNEVTFTRENSKKDGRFKLTRQESNMSILDYPNNQDIHRKKREEPQASTNTLNKIMHNQPKQIHKDHIHKDQIEAICKAVLQKSQKRTEYTSLSNLDKIVSEAKAKEADDAMADKSASSGLLDVIDSCEVSPSPISVKQVINNFEVFPSPIAPRKYNKPADNKPQPIKKTEGTADGASGLGFRLPFLETTEVVDTKEVDTKMVITGDDIYDNPPQSNRPVSLSDSEDEHADDIYVDPPNNRPVINVTDNHLYDIYDDPTNNRPAFNTVHKDEIDDDVNSENFASDKGSISKQQIKNDATTGDVYDFPPPLSRGITITNDKSGYSMTLTTSKEPCFDSSYVNARSFNCKKT